MSEFNRGAEYVRDNILASIIGLQNGIGHNNLDDPTYKAYQKVYNLIKERYGDMFDKFKNNEIKEGHNLAKMYISGEFDTDINVSRNEVTDEIRKEVHIYLDCEIREDELLDDKCYAFYYKCMKAGLHSADADRYASLNTLLNYDIGINNAMMIDKWMYNHHTDIFELKATDNEDKMFLALAVAELGLDIDFGGWITEDYTEYSYF